NAALDATDQRPAELLPLPEWAAEAHPRTLRRQRAAD
nr:hypothetical protein [Tanacetum cinerariifolium]